MNLSKKFAVTVTFKFEGTVEVEASSEEEAKNIVESGFGLVLGGGIHTNDSRISDWNFNAHPDKELGIGIQEI
jgi:hypothetical protein